MKRFISFVVVIIYLLSSLNAQQYKNGTYEAQSRLKYRDEPFVAHVKITIKNDSIVAIKFWIVDTVRKELFDDKYERHYKDNPEYVEQCRNDWNGIQQYPKFFLVKQKISQLDALTGATWSYNMFVAALEEALKQARCEKK
ncbi:MAG TPA: FMN-binding protein [Bacteroidales bacterium]|nr:FMN-binding protein [Bacteroidales bacterium]HOK98362.1 FMN-binding protein [Bacteroidales bacterium]HPO65229.1 FMN-binding protein [Bacteroidales bacterium]